MLAFGGKQSRQGNLTPRTLNSLSAITAEQAHEAEEEEWEREMRDWRGEDGVCLISLILFNEIFLWISLCFTSGAMLIRIFTFA